MFTNDEFCRNLILKNYKKPQNYGLSKNVNYVSYNHKDLSCGDNINLQINLQNKKIIDIKYELQACAICFASASLMSNDIKNHHIDVVFEKINNFLAMINNQKFDATKISKELSCFFLFKNFPRKILCVSLPWQALKKLLQSLSQ